MLTGKRLGSRMHAFGIQRAEGPAYLPALDSGPNRVVVNNVTVAPVSRGKARVEFAYAITGPVHGNIVGQRGIDTHHPGAQVSDRRSVKMGNLITGMNAGIGAACANQVNRMIRNPRNRSGQFRFNRADAGFLKLPAMEVPAIVFESKGNAPCPDGVIRSKLLGFEKQV